MKKVYSKKVGGEVFALAPEQLEVFRNAGYQTPAPEEVIADAGAAMLTPPEDKRAYVVLNLKSGEFAVRVRSCTLKGNEFNTSRLSKYSGLQTVTIPVCRKHSRYVLPPSVS